MNDTTLNVSEIFFSLQGEGNRAGTPNVFIRLQGCKTKNACYASGIRCDTEFESGRPMSLEQIREAIDASACKKIIWTGGEPAQQLTAEIVAYFAEAGYFQSIETSGLLPVPAGLNYVCVSPKVAEHVVAKNFPHGVDELRYVRHAGQDIPQPAVAAKHYFISPHSNGDQLDRDNLAHCIELVKRNPKWRLSLQLHKVWQVL
jgi:7-carboxy-7-deazaguanine synthase